MTDPSTDICVVVPAYNEAGRLPPTLLDMVNYFEVNRRNYRILVVDDGSTDETASLVEKFSSVRPQIGVLRIPCNKGKGNAVREGMLAVSASRLLFADADGSTPIEELSRLEKALDDGADLAIGSRALSSAETTVETRWYRKYIGRLFNGLVNFFVLPGIADTQCGFKLFSEEAAEFLFSRQRSERFSFDVEILYIARKAGLSIAEVPVNWKNVPNSKVNLVIDSARMLFDIFRFMVWHKGVTPKAMNNSC